MNILIYIYIYNYLYMNSTIPKRHAGMLRNRNIPFQSKNQNSDRNGINNYDWNCVQMKKKKKRFIAMQNVLRNLLSIQSFSSRQTSNWIWTWNPVDSQSILSVTLA